MVDEPPRVAGGWGQTPFIYFAAWSLNDYVARAIVTTNVPPDRYAQAFGTRRLLTLHNTLRATLKLPTIYDPSSTTIDADGRRMHLVVMGGLFMPAAGSIPPSPPVRFGAVAIHSSVMDRVDALKGLALRSPFDRRATPELLAEVADYWFDANVRMHLANVVETLDAMLPPEGRFALTKSSRREAIPAPTPAGPPPQTPAALPPPAAEAPRPATRAGFRRKGRPAASDAEADARLVADWDAARGQGTLKREFCELRGIKFRALDLAIDRARKRARRSE
ncbi:MAG: hypothetical protein BGO49_09370 [Planctomycetales bacterium 71-10]|nr:MAG: hypothetical protein BGO49_09370 [Planctomycetales bacterium 71-10]